MRRTSKLLTLGRGQKRWVERLVSHSELTRMGVANGLVRNAAHPPTTRWGGVLENLPSCQGGIGQRRLLGTARTRQNSRFVPPKSRRTIKDLVDASISIVNDPKKVQVIGYDVDGLLQDWNAGLKQYGTTSRESVEVLDSLVRALLKSKQARSHEHFATEVGVAAWARLSAEHPDAASRAEALFQMLDFQYQRSITSLNKSIGRHRRNLYHAVLLAISRSSHSSKPQRALYWLEQMKNEEVQFQLRGLVNNSCYNRVLFAFASTGDTAKVLSLVAEMKENRLSLNADSYDCLIKAYQYSGDTYAQSEAYKLFREMLESYRSTAKSRWAEFYRPQALTLRRLIGMFEDDPDKARQVLDYALEFVDDCPECVGLVEINGVSMVLHAYTSKGLPEKAEEMLMCTISRYESGDDNLEPNELLFVTVMNGYAQRKTEASLEKVASMLDMLERFLGTEGRASSRARFSAAIYNVLMTAYLRSWPINAVEKIRETIDRMKRVAKRWDRPEFAPNVISMSILMKALIKQCGPGYEEEVESILTELKAGPHYDVDMRVFSIAIWAFVTSDDPAALSKGQAIFDGINTPNATCYNTLIKLYGKYGLSDSAFATLRRMRADFDSGVNPSCSPDLFTYTAVVQSLIASDDRDCWEKALTAVHEWLATADKPKETPKGKSTKGEEIFVAKVLHVLQLSDKEDKDLLALELLDKLQTRQLRLGSVVALAFIDACGETAGTEATRRRAFSSVTGLLERSGPDLSDLVYTAALSAASKLLVDPDERHAGLRKIFQLCTDAGQLTSRTLRKMKDVGAYDTNQALTAQEAGNDAQLDYL